LTEAYRCQEAARHALADRRGARGGSPPSQRRTLNETRRGAAMRSLLRLARGIDGRRFADELTLLDNGTG
jgi:hypothetical protein